MPARSVTSSLWRIPQTNRLRALFLSLALLFSSCARPIDPPDSLFGKLEGFLEMEDYRAASALAEETLKKHPRSLRLQFLLGKSELLRGNFEEALAALQKAKGGGLRGYQLTVCLALAHFYLGHMEEAQLFTRRVVALEPENRWSAKQLGYLSYYLGDGKRAIEIFERLKESDPADDEAAYTVDALLALTGEWPASQMVWTTEPDAGLQLCYPGGWTRKVTQHLGPAGKVTTTSFVGPTPDEVGRFRFGQMLLLTVFQNAAAHPSPEVFRGSYRRGERTGAGERRYATRPNPEAGFEKMSRDPATVARGMSSGSLQSILDGWDLSVTGVRVNPWTAKRGRATYCQAQAAAEDPYGNTFVGYGLGIYDPTTDTFSSLVLVAPAQAEKQATGISQTIFNLALFGGIVGIPPAPQGFVDPEEFEARIQGFLQAGQPDRALTEAKRAIEIYPKVADLRFLQGESERALWHMEEAVAAYEEARRLGFANFSLEMALGQLYLGLGRPEKAEQAFGRTLELRSSDPNALLGVGQALYRQGKWDEALGFFERALLESPKLEEARYFAQAMKAIYPEGKSDLLRWFKAQTGGFSFPVPVGWGKYELDVEGGLSQILFTKDLIQLPSAEFETGLLYLCYDRAHARMGKVERPKPEEIPQEFFLQSFERITDPQKVLQAIGPVLRLGLDRYLVGGYAYTEGAHRRLVRTLSYYETAQDRLHVLTFRATGTEFSEWEPYVAALFACAGTSHPGSP